MLSQLVTTGYYKESFLYSLIAKIYPKVKRRSCKYIDDTQIKTILSSDIIAYALNIFGCNALRNKYIYRQCEKVGNKCGELAIELNNHVLVYNYIAPFTFEILKNKKHLKLLFQCHPHPKTCREILESEIKLNPEWSNNILEEAEFAYGKDYYDKMCKIPHLADGIICESEFIKESLIGNGVNEKKIKIVQYGTNANFERNKKEDNDVLKLLYVGQISQRKGLQYLFNAMELLGSDCYELTMICRPRKTIPVRVPRGVNILYDVSYDELQRKYRDANVFVFPSLVEGWGLVVTEAMSLGLPVITTNNTCGRDIINNQENGIVIPIQSTDALVSAIQFLAKDKLLREKMSENAIETVGGMTWDKFRISIAETVKEFVS